MKRVLAVILNLTVLSGMLCIWPGTTKVFGEETSLSSLQEGKKLLDTGRYNEAIIKLTRAYKELPVIGDYTILFMAEAYSKAKNYDDSNHSIDELLKTYPDTLLKKRARALQIRNSIARAEAASQKNSDSESMLSLKQYTIDYPEDIEMAFLHAKLLKKRGEIVKANTIFKQIYIANNSYSESAYHELMPSDITADDMLAKASNLIKVMEYKKAESILRKTLTKSDKSLRGEIHKELGITLFKQKRYKEAADEFLKIGDIYNASRSMFRGGELDAFSKAVSRLISMEDPRAGHLLTALASKKRREGKTVEALEIYNNIKNKYPSRNEDAMWGIAWTHYRNADYQRALDVLTELNDKYHNSKYLYWKARSIDNTVKEGEHGDGGVSSEPIYQQIKSLNRDFYSLLAQTKDKAQIGHLQNLQLTSVHEPLVHNDICNKKDTGNILNLDEISSPQQQGFHNASRSLERFNILVELGMREEAISELIQASRGISSPRILIYLGYRLQDVGAYKKAIYLISQLNSQLKVNQSSVEASGLNIDEIFYPFAYWPIVMDVSNHYNLDPFILLSVMREESRYDPGARSPAGALGLMQIMPQTAYSFNGELKVNIPNKDTLHDIRINITIGAYYLKMLLNEFASLPVALAAYNAGHEKVREWLKEGNYKSYDEFIEDLAYDETRNYVKGVLMTYNIYRQQALKCAKNEGAD